MRWEEAEVTRIGGFESRLLDLRLRYRFADRETLTVGGGEAFHLRAGHLAEVLEEAELIEFTAAEQYRRKAEHLAARSGRER